MKRMKRFFCLMCSLCLMLLTAVPVRAAAAEETANGYTDKYTIRIFPGQQGSFKPGTEGLTPDGYIEYQIEYNSVTGKQFNPNNCVELFRESAEEESKYYIRGFRESGKDNKTVQTSAAIGGSGFAVTRDQDYVVAYGVRGNGTYYTIRYVNAAGESLLDEDRYYGNVGDKPVVAYRYIDGYQPQAYNMTKTLEKNESENIFTFVYSPIPAGGGGVTTTTTTVVEDLGTTVVPGGGGAAAAPGGGAAAAPEGGGEAPTVIPEEETPLAPPDDLIDLDEEETPLAGGSLFNTDVNGNATLLGVPIPVIIVCGAVIAGGAAGLVVYLKKRKKKEA